MDQQVLRPILYILLRRRRGGVLADPSVNVIGKPLVEFREVLRDDKPIASDVPTVSDREGVGLARLLFHRKTGKTNGLDSDFSSIALHGYTSFRKDLNYMRASLRGREELAGRVQRGLALATKKEAEHVVNTVITSLETTLLNNLGTDGFTLKLGSFGKFHVRHKPGILRKIPFTGNI